MSSVGGMAITDKVRFGILGCAKIARQVARAISLSEECELHAVGSRSLEKAVSFVLDNGLPASVRIYGSYEAVLDDPEVDAAYIPLPTTLHMEIAVLAAKRKKHVLLEKPVALNIGELDRILEACRANGVQFMDGTMWMHHPRTAKMKEALLDVSRFGQLKLIHSFISYNAGPEFLENDIRVKPDLDALGALGDIGWYCIRSILWAVNYQLPNKVVAMHEPVYNDAGVILSAGASLYWSDGKVATFHCSFLNHMAFEVTAFGTTGIIRVSDIITPFQDKYATFYSSSVSDFAEVEPGQWAPAPKEHRVDADVPQEVVMVSEFARLVSGINTRVSKPDEEWVNISRKTQLVLDAVKDSLMKNYQSVEIIE
ncbi:hypothetical protein MLD38_006426 [Melastoma candidum]|uniref:Uncharacterized protein n=1 Tax=Melastoma candidum TaxID=119954 RepID=A0ACB9RS09_9MYRT|nr:hypothetical protein MLD38_006426 [Melastoma candidum]